MVETWSRRAVWGAFAYSGALALWLAVYVVVGDRSALLFAANSLLLFAFLPVPVLFVLGVALRRRLLVVMFMGLAGIWCWLWGGLFVPRGVASSSHATITALTYNALGYNFDTRDTVAVVRDSRADVVAVQELNPETAKMLEAELGDVYPYRWLEPRAGVTGGGLLSKYPFERTQSIGGPWIGSIMVVELRVEGHYVTLVRFHAYAGPGYFRQREEQARALAAYAHARHGPLIMLGDLNATDRNSAHATIAAELRDAWREVGWGFGHTFPGTPTPREGGSRPTIFGIPVPKWLVRIDYVFHSPDLVALSAHTAGDGSRSDHRGVLVTLAL